MLVVAGAIEAAVTPHMGPWIRCGVALLSALGLYIYFRKTFIAFFGDIARNFRGK
jgi:hypothetical protein